MKNIKLSICAVLLSLGFVACESEITEPVVGTTTSTQHVTLGFTDDSNGTTILEDGGQSTITVSLSSVLPYDAMVELEVTSSDYSLESDGIAEVSYDNVITIPAGSTSGSSTFTFVNDEKDDALETYSIGIKNTTTASTLTTHYITLVADEAQTSRSLVVVDALPTTIETTAGVVDVDLQWADGSRDMDFYLMTAMERPTLGNTIDFSEGLTTTESVALPDTADDSTYYLFINQYQFVADVDYTVTFTFPDGQTHVISSTVNDDTHVASFDKVTDGNTVKYIITKL